MSAERCVGERRAAAQGGSLGAREQQGVRAPAVEADERGLCGIGGSRSLTRHERPPPRLEG